MQAVSGGKAMSGKNELSLHHPLSTCHYVLEKRGENTPIAIERKMDSESYTSHFQFGTAVRAGETLRPQ